MEKCENWGNRENREEREEWRREPFTKNFVPTGENQERISYEQLISLLLNTVEDPSY